MTRNQKIGVMLSICGILIITTIIVMSLLAKPVYLVEFYTNGGTNIENQEVKAKNKIIKPGEPTREGFVFDGWYLDNKEFNFDNEITRNTVLEAHWTLEEKKMVTLSFDSLGGSIVEEVQLEAGTILENIPNPTKEGYLFQGWYYLNKAYQFNTPILEDMTFIAKWKKAS